MTILQYFKLLEYFPFMIKVNFRDYEKMTVRVTQDQNLTKKKFKIRKIKNGNRKWDENYKLKKNLNDALHFCKKDKRVFLIKRNEKPEISMAKMFTYKDFFYVTKFRFL